MTPSPKDYPFRLPTFPDNDDTVGDIPIPKVLHEELIGSPEFREQEPFLLVDPSTRKHDTLFMFGLVNKGQLIIIRYSQARLTYQEIFEYVVNWFKKTQSKEIYIGSAGLGRTLSDSLEKFLRIPIKGIRAGIICIFGK